MITTHGRRMRAGMIALAAIAVLAGAACTPSALAAVYRGGTVPLDVTVPPQTISYDFAGCQTTITTPAINLTGATATIPATTIDPTKRLITIPNVTVDIPPTSVTGVSAGIVCRGVQIGSVTFSMTIGGTGSTQSATLDTVTKVLTLTQSSLTLANSSIDISGVGSFPLPPITVTLPTVTLKF